MLCSRMLTASMKGFLDAPDGFFSPLNNNHPLLFYLKLKDN